mmetsp:Transcript_50333/g.113101  ORF Transcript_50333/g.113101 Transcript_50333/m.113101 type:complete len:240 (-) Transcript_50333:356-1075(-)
MPLLGLLTPRGARQAVEDDGDGRPASKLVEVQRGGQWDPYQSPVDHVQKPRVPPERQRVGRAHAEALLQHANLLGVLRDPPVSLLAHLREPRVREAGGLLASGRLDELVEGPHGQHAAGPLSLAHDLLRVVARGLVEASHGLLDGGYHHPLRLLRGNAEGNVVGQLYAEEQVLLSGRRPLEVDANANLPQPRLSVEVVFVVKTAWPLGSALSRRRVEEQVGPRAEVVLVAVGLLGVAAV